MKALTKMMLFLSLLIFNQDVAIAQVYDYSPSGYVYGYSSPDNIEIKIYNFDRSAAKTRFKARKHDGSAFGRNVTVHIRLGSVSGPIIASIPISNGDFDGTSNYYYFSNDLQSGDKRYYGTLLVDDYLHRAGPLTISVRLNTPIVAPVGVNGSSINISWQPVALATIYRVVISRSSSFTPDPNGNSPFPSSVFNETTSNTSITVDNFPPGVYYISVRAGSNFIYHSLFCVPVTATISQQGFPNILVNPTSLVINQQSIPDSPVSNGGFVDRWNPVPTNRPAISEANFGKGAIIPDSVVSFWKDKTPRTVENSDNLPSTIDWSYRDSPVKNQLNCGSCWAMASIALLENLGLQTDLSEQELVSCVTGSSCAGGSYADALNYLSTSGAVSESCYPYQNSNGSCSEKCAQPSFVEKITGVSNFLWGQATVDLLRNELQNGPLIVYTLIPLGWSYSGGVYEYTGGEIPTTQAHALLLVGYDEQSFLFKNSWGETWGENGYGRVSYSTVNSPMRFGWYASSASGYQTIYTNSSSQIVIKNTGNAALDVTSISSNRPWLTTSASNFTLAAGLEYMLPVSVNWSYLGQYAETAYLTVTSNDPDQSVTIVDVTAVPAQISGIDENKNVNPQEYSLQNHPNPFNPETVIRFSMPVASYTKGVVYDLLGREVATLLDGDLPAGDHSVKFNAADLPSGVYIFRLLTAGKESKTIKMVLNK